jgi:hypothetical protein
MNQFNFRRAILGLFIGFMLLLTLRLGYGYYRWPNGVVTIETDQQLHGNTYANSGNLELDGNYGSKRNYASTKYSNNVTIASSPTGIPTYDQKYEKIATMSSRSTDFDKEVATVKAIIKKQEGLIQYEQQSGLKDQRYLHLAIGIPPDNFDNAVDALKVIGTLTNIRIDKTDKTNDFQKLKASRAALQAQLESLMKLKTHEGKIEELMDLEEKILSINTQLQNLGVSLGEFDSQNEFCTVKFSLTEQVKPKESISDIPFFNRLFVALGWTVKCYALLMFAFAAGCVGLFVAIKVWKGFFAAFKQPE